jgi:hypothetical protein
LWLFPNGDCTLSYDSFVQEITIFADSFFAEMAERIDLAVSKDWGETVMDKDSLMPEQLYRRDSFYRDIDVLFSNSKADWSNTLSIISEMKSRFRFKN